MHANGYNRLQGTIGVKTIHPKVIFTLLAADYAMSGLYYKVDL